MKKLIILFLLLFITNIYSYFDYQDFSTKASSSGGTAVANLMNSDCIFYNPAILGKLNNTHISFNYDNLYPDVINNDIYLYNFSLSKDLPNSSIGAGYHGFTSDNYFEKMIILGYGYDLKLFQTGLNIKYGNVSFEKNVKYDPLLNDKALNFYTFDIGILYPENNTTMGLSILNLLSNKEGLYKKTMLNQKINIGISQLIFKKFIVSGEINYLKNYMNYRLGANILVIKDILSVNMGFNKQKLSFGLSSTYEKFSFDYTSEYSLLFSSLQFSQKFGFRVKI